MTARKTATKKTAAKPEPQTPETEAPPSMSALDAAALVLGEAATPMTVGQVLDDITRRGLWSSPAGKTPSATIYAGIFREIERKGDGARFARAGRGLFAAAPRTVA